MTRKVRARARVGRFEPLEASDLAEGTEVAMSIVELPETTAAEDAFARATWFQYDLTLLSSNGRHFEMVEGLQGPRPRPDAPGALPPW